MSVANKTKNQRISDKESFDLAFNKLPLRPKQVLLRVLKGEADDEIASALGVGSPTVRKHMERIATAFGLQSNERRSRRSQVIALIAQYKPELLNPNQTNNDLENYTKTVRGETNKELIVGISYRNNKKETLFSKITGIGTKKQDKQELAVELNKVGYKHYLDGQYKDAFLHFQLAIQYDPNFSYAHYNLGSTYENLGDIESAYHHYQKAAKYKNRAGYLAINNLSRLEIIVNRNFKDAIEQIESIIDDVEYSDIKALLYKNLAWAYFELELLEEAKKHLEISLELDNNNLPALYLLVLVLLYEPDKEETKTIEKARSLWNKCLEQESNSNEKPLEIAMKLPELNMWKSEINRSFKKCTLVAV